MSSHSSISLRQIQAAQKRIANTVLRTPLVPLNIEESPAQIFLKLENLQPIGSFKLRGASNFIASAESQHLGKGVWTASAGNMAQGVAYCARRLELDCSVVVPDNAPETKVAAIKRLGAEVIKVSYEEWLHVFRTRQHEAMEGLFVHAFSDAAVMAGNGTIGLEILEELPDVDVVIIPYGGGGLSCGIAAAIRALKPGVKLYACEVDSAAPLATSLAAGEPTKADYRPSFVDGIGAPVVFPEMFQLASQLLDGSLVVSLAEVAAAIRILVDRNRVIAEGAGAAPVAAALGSKAAGMVAGRKLVCVISGGNINAGTLIQILQGRLP